MDVVSADPQAPLRDGTYDRELRGHTLACEVVDLRRSEPRRNDSGCGVGNEQEELDAGDRAQPSLKLRCLRQPLTQRHDPHRTSLRTCASSSCLYAAMRPGGNASAAVS